MHKKALSWTAAAALLALAMVLPAFAQPGSSAPAASTSAASADTIPHAYRLDFSVSELQGEKQLDSRQYSMTVTSGSSNNVKIGTRVPVATGNTGQFQYLDVGTSIWCRLEEHSGDLVLNVRSDISNFAAGDSLKTANQPVVRQLNINAGTVLTAGQPAVLGTVDDPTSARQFRLQVTATRLH